MRYQQIKDIIEWDVYNWSRLLTLFQPIVNNLPANPKILAVGERSGGLSLWLAQQGFNVECTDRVFIDNSAQKLHEKYHVEDKIKYYELDIVNDSLQYEYYDLVIMKSVLGGLKEEYNNTNTRTDKARRKAINNIYNGLKPNGYLITSDNMKGSVMHQFIRNRYNKNASWHYFMLEEYRNIFELFKQINTSYFAIFPTWPKSAILGRFIYMINRLLSPIVSKSQQYIAFTYARK